METSKLPRAKLNTSSTNHHLPRPHIPLGEASALPTQPSEPVLSPDQVLLHKIKESLSQLNYLQFEQLSVTVSDGRVKLDGQVAWYYWRQLAENAMINTPGVRDLDSNLIVYSRNQNTPVCFRREVADEKKTDN